jgi:hypothetical protein
LKRNIKYRLLILFLTIPTGLLCAQDRPLAIWKFDAIETEEEITPQGAEWWQKPEMKRAHYIREGISGHTGTVNGNYFKLVPGISGNALLLDGISSFIQSRDMNVPLIQGDFSISAWLALAAYPTNWCPVADHNISSGKGFFLGVDAYGHAGFKLFNQNGFLYKAQSDDRIPLRKWVHIEGVYSSDEGIVLYLDGRIVARSKINGDFEPAGESDLLIGRHSIQSKPEGTIRPHATEAVHTFFDGLIDELTLYGRCRSSEEISEYVTQLQPASAPDLQPRSLPSINGQGEFGAFYTTLRYYDAWDALWRVGNSADIAVRFNDLEGKLFFWRGTSYIPHWVTENGIWYNNEFLETWSEKGCLEPMSDKRCQYSSVRIIENTPARVVVHWRYALSDNWYNISRVDSLTGWGEWVDEVYTIYPDGVAVRNATLHSAHPATSFEWQESISVMGPCTHPEDILQPEALTFVNLMGDAYSYSWENGIPSETDEEGFVLFPENPVIQMINTKSKLKSFVILDPAANPRWRIFRNELQPDVSMFPWWNHWPTAQNACDGRFAIDSDLASHSSLSNANWDAYSKKYKTVSKIMLHGLTAGTGTELVPLAKSWSNPPVIKTNGSENYRNDGYDPSERAYKITCLEKGHPEKLVIELVANPDSPLINFCLLVENWGKYCPQVAINNRPLTKNEEFQFGHRLSPAGTDLLLWVKFEDTNPIEINIAAE